MSDHRHHETFSARLHKTGEAECGCSRLQSVPYSTSQTEVAVLSCPAVARNDSSEDGCTGPDREPLLDRADGAPEVIELGQVGLIASLLIAAVFIVAAVTKLADRAGTRTAVREFGAPASLAGFLAIGLPVAELSVAVAIVYGPTRTIGAAGALGLLLVFSVAIAIRLGRGSAPNCNCFGQLHSEPVSWKTLARNGVLAVLAGSALAAGLEGKTPSAIGWIGGMDSTSTALIVVTMLSVALAVGGGIAFFTLLRSYGKVLLRLDQLELRLTSAGIGAQAEESPPEIGHAPGTKAPAFATADTSGRRVSLDDLLQPAQPLLLLFMSANCGPCRALLPKVAEWQNEQAHRLTIAIADSGNHKTSVFDAARYGIERVLADTELAIYNAYRAGGTPGAVLIAADGSIASWVAAGTESVNQLLNRAVANVESEKPALPVGSPAPDIMIPLLDAEPVNPARVKQPTLVLFWNPGCGFCSSMRDDVLEWERHPPVDAPRLLVVSSGDERSVRAEGFSSMVALDTEFSAGAAFGANGTPMAILIDGDGRIASGLAAGAESVFALAGGRARNGSGHEAKSGLRVTP